MIEANQDDWRHQLARHFQPFARKERQGYFLTAVIPCPEHNAALCVRIGDRRIRRDSAIIRAELQTCAETALQENNLARRVFGNIDVNPWNLATLATGLASAAGVYVATGNGTGTALAGISAYCCAGVYQGWQASRRMDLDRKDAEAVTRQFHPKGDPPQVRQAYVADVDLSLATLYHRCPPDAT